MYHKLLQKQINKYMPADLRGEERLREFLDSIHASYASLDRDREMMDHAFRVSEREFAEVNARSNHLADQRLRSLGQLNETIASLLGTRRVQEEEDNLVALSERIRNQVNRSKVTEENLKRHNKLFKTLLGNLNSGVLVESEDRKILFTNDTFCSLFQIPARADDLIGADCSQSAEQSKGMFKDPVAFVQGIEALLEKQEAVYQEIVETSDGKLLERDYVPIFVDGIYRGHLWKYTDVTEQVRYQEVLREREERNRLVMNSSLDAIVISDRTGRIQYWNPRAEQLFGWTQEEARGQQMSELFIPLHRGEAHHRGMHRYLTTKVSHIMNQVLELSAVNKAGEEFPIELIVVTYQQNGEPFFCGFMKDISARKKSENLLRSQEEKFRNIIAHMNLGLLEVDHEENILFANQSFCEISGYGVDELVGSKTDLFVLSDRERDLLQSKGELRTQGISDGYEVEVKNRQGEQRWWFVSGAPNYNDTGELVGSIGIHLDITKQKQLESELAVAKDKAEEASVAKEAFLANMSHEIRTPLNAIIGMIRELSREELSPKQQTYLNHTDTAARHLLSIVNSILDLSKIEAGELALDEHEFSLDAVIANLKSILYVKAKDKNIGLGFEVSDRIWPAYTGDSARIRQILINLLDNAIKFTLEGSVQLRVEVLEESLATQKIRIAITDTGIGMDKVYLGQLFSKFSQAEKSTSRRFGGTGLGMSISKQILEMMGGSITVESQKGKGTCFNIEVELAKGDANKLAKPTRNSQYLLQGTRVLLVEDNIMNRFIATKSLSHFGCVVEEAENGMVALDRLRESTYDLIMMDIQMPELDGVATTRIIREELNLDIPIIAVTANAFKKDIDLYLSIGMNDYVTKPFEESALFRTLSRQVGAREPIPAPTMEEPEPGELAYDLSKLRELSRGDEQFVQQMVDIFIAHTTTAIHEMRQALEQGDFTTVAKIAHRIKPSIDSMAITRLRGVAKDIEKYGTSDVPDGEVITERVRLLTGVLAEVIEQLKRDGSTVLSE